MRKLIVVNIMSLDGYYEASGQNIMPLFNFREAYPEDDTFDVYNASRLRAADTLLLGRASYEGFKSYWPDIADDPDEPPIQREISRLDNAIEKVVISDSLTPDQTAPWQDTTRIIRRAEAEEQIAALKQQPGRDILMFGSRTLWNALLARDLVDELHLVIAPVVLGEGTPLFDGPPPVTPRLIEARARSCSGIVVVTYDVRRPKA